MKGLLLPLPQLPIRKTNWILRKIFYTPLCSLSYSLTDQNPDPDLKFNEKERKKGKKICYI